MANRIILRRDTAAAWTIANPILANGEIGLETDTERFKIGNGVEPWADRSYYANAEFITAGVQALIDEAILDVGNAVVTMNAVLDEQTEMLSDTETARNQAQTAAALAGTTTDTLVNGVVNNGASATRGSINTIFGPAATQTFTNKTINLGSNTLRGTAAQFNSAMTDGDFITADSDVTFTNKHIDLANNTLWGSIDQFNTALTSLTFVTETQTQTLTNKTLQGGWLDSVSMVTSNITDPTIVGGTSVGFSVVDGIISNCNFTGRNGRGFLYKTATQTFSDNATWVNDNHLFFTATANSIYIFQFAWGVGAGSGAGLEASVTHGGVGTFTHEGISPLDAGHINGGTGRLNWGDSGSGLAHGRAVNNLWYHNNTGSSVTVQVRFRTIDAGSITVNHAWLKWERVV